MDPLKVFPPEVVDEIWVRLKPQDLLACRAVASHWLNSVTSCDEAWFTEFSHDWYEFLEAKKTLRRWSSGKVRRCTFTEVKDCVFTPAAYYLRMSDDTLNMFSPEGCLIRTFKHKVRSLHHGLGGLLIGVKRPWENRPTNDERNGHFDTLVTDGVMNVVNSLPNTVIFKAFPHGFVGQQREEFFIELNNRRFPCDAPTALNKNLHLTDHCVVSVRGLIDKTVDYFDVDNPEFVILRTFKASPMTIPTVQVTIGPKNLFSVSATLGDFVRIFVYDKETIVLEATVTDYPERRAQKYCFTQDFFVVFHDTPAYLKSCTVYRLDDFKVKWTVELRPPPDFIITSHSCSYLKNFIVASKFNPLRPHVTPPFQPQLLYFCQIDELNLDVACRVALEMAPFHPLKFVLGCFCSYFYAIERIKHTSNIHLTHFLI